MFTKNSLNHQGFTYITAIIVVAVMGIGLNAAGTYWSTTMKRERERELLFRGDQIRRAIKSYHGAAAGGEASRYPKSLKGLLKDPRSPTVRRHIRRLFKDPMGGDGEWGLILASGGGIKGIFSTSTETPIKKGHFTTPYECFERATNYRDWRFVHPMEPVHSPMEAGVGDETSF
jgi:type II secretory pathway pseudopilin PulG